MHLRGVAFRAHDPRWSFKPLSGDGAALYGGRYNRKGVPELYLALDAITAVREITQGLDEETIARVTDALLTMKTHLTTEPQAKYAAAGE